MLFGAMLETVAEHATFDTDPKAGCAGTVLKAGHHGSFNTSTGMSCLRRSPRSTCSSASATATVRHAATARPWPLKARLGLRWVRTDENGTVSLNSDGSHYTVSRSKGRESGIAVPATALRRSTSESARQRAGWAPQRLPSSVI